MDRPKPLQGQAAQTEAAHDLPADVVQRVEELFARLDELDHYRLLGIAREATRAQIRTAFLRCAPAFHPDRYFGKRLGDVGPKMHQVFARFSLAHDTLLAQEQRARYDETLAPETAPPPAPPPAPTFVAPPSPMPPPATASMQAPIPAPTKPSESGPMRRASISISVEGAERARREAFAARLAGRSSSSQLRAPSPSSSPPSPSSRPAPPVSGAAPAPRTPPPPVSVEAAKAATEALRRRYEEQVHHAKERHLSSHTQQGQAAAARGDFEAAATHYREAMAHSSDPAIKIAYDDATSRSKRAVSEASLSQARAFEAQKAWPEAAAAYARVFNLAPSADVAFRAANAYRRQAADPRRAAHFAEEAVKLAPNEPTYRLTLALIYVDAGLMVRARGELDRAQALDPKHPLIRDVMAKLRLR